MLLRIPDSDSHFLIPLRIPVSFLAFIFFSFAFNLEMQAKGIQSPDLWETSSEVTMRTPALADDPPTSRRKQRSRDLVVFQIAGDEEGRRVDLVVAPAVAV
jgi:hypothetical protein